MKFTSLVATVAIITFAVNANAYSDGTLRRNSGDVKVAQNDTTPTSSKEVNININTNAQQASQQPTTVVEAAPVAESKAEGLRKERQEAEVGTEQKIVEKLEESRLQEEKARADRLFGNKLDPQPAAQPAAPAPVPAPAPVAEKPAPAPDKPAQVTIEKVEIVNPAPVAPVVEKAEPVAESKAEVKDVKDETKTTKYYVSGLAGNLSYQASNVHSNYGLGVAVGTILDERVAIELSYFYSNHTIDDISSGAIYHKLDQSDVAVSGKYYILTGKLKPYVGASMSYINRKYQDRLYPGAWGYGGGYGYGGYGGYGYNNINSETTQSVDMGILAGVDFAFTEQFMVGLGFDYNFNVMTMNNLNNAQYYWGYSGYPSGWDVQQLERISYYGIKATAKFTF